MSAVVARRARLLRVRTAACRAAVARLAAAERAETAIATICARVADVRGGIDVSPGEQPASTLQSQSELAERLDHARAGLAGSLDAAQQLRASRAAEHDAAVRAEQRAGNLHAETLRQEATAYEVRAAADLPPRSRAAGTLS